MDLSSFITFLVTMKTMQISTENDYLIAYPSIDDGREMGLARRSST